VSAEKQPYEPVDTPARLLAKAIVASTLPVGLEDFFRSAGTTVVSAGPNPMHGLIGDIHGHADALLSLLRQLGYVKQKGVYRHPERQAIFLGDFIDRGPKIRETLEIVRPMVESGAALSVMGNHELNALAFHSPHPEKPGDHLRPHNETNSHQHAETRRQISAGEPDSYLAWFRTLPLWLDLEGLRVIHACWDERMITKVQGTAVTDEFLVSACLLGGELLGPVETLLKGKEAKLPEGVTITDKDGHARAATRVRWFDDPSGHTYGSYSMEPVECDLPMPSSVLDEALPYPEDAKPVFVGHYWLKGLRPELLRRNIACVDWSVAKGGFLCAYRWDGERELDQGKFVWKS